MKRLSTKDTNRPRHTTSYHVPRMFRLALILPLVALTLFAGSPRAAVKPGATYLYTYYDKQLSLIHISEPTRPY